MEQICSYVKRTEPWIKYIIHRYDYDDVFLIMVDDSKNKNHLEYMVEITPFYVKLLNSKQGDLIVTTSGEYVVEYQKQED